jgi:hypothetical protein
MSGPLWHADIEVGENEDGWVMSARLPGFAPDDIRLDITDRELVIEALRPGDEPTADFAYRLAIPPDADPAAIDASMRGDLLAVRIPRLQRLAPRRVPVRHYETDSPDGSAADGSLLGPSPGSVASPAGTIYGAGSGSSGPAADDVEVIRPAG